MSEEQQAGPSAAMQQFQLNSQIASAGAGGGGGEGADAPGSLIDTLLRLIGVKSGLNGHSTGGLDSIFNIGSIFSGLSMQSGSIFGKLDMRGGVLGSFFAKLGFNFGGSIHGDVTAGLQASNVDTSGMPSGGGGGGGGDTQTATLNTIPSAAIHDTGIQNFQGSQVTDIAPMPRASSVKASRSEGAGMER